MISLIGEDGRSPDPPNPAYQQVLRGVPAADFGSNDLLYLPRNMRSHRLFGFSPVGQIALTINVALRREQATLDHFNTVRRRIRSRRCRRNGRSIR